MTTTSSFVNTYLQVREVHQRHLDEYQAKCRTTFLTVVVPTLRSLRDSFEQHEKESGIAIRINDSESFIVLGSYAYQDRLIRNFTIRLSDDCNRVECDITLGHSASDITDWISVGGLTEETFSNWFLERLKKLDPVFAAR